MRRVSLNARMLQDAEASGELYVVLIEIAHPDLDEPILLSTDNTERLSDDPLYYGTRSLWRSQTGRKREFLWVVASTLLPSDLDDAPASATIILENLDRRIAEVTRSFTAPAVVAMAVVLASSPDQVEAEYSDLKLTSSEIKAGEVTLSISREEVESEYVPGGRMTSQTFPGLHR